MKEDFFFFFHKDFGDDLSEWIDFVCHCRDGGEDYKKYDLISGKVANDKVFRVVDMYHSGLWDKERAIKETKKSIYKSWCTIFSMSSSKYIKYH